MNLNYSLLLGSKSPRRLQLLQVAGFDPEVVEIISKEVFPQLLPVMEVARFLAEQKAEAYIGNLENQILLTADTIVTIDDQILGKPKDDQEAKQMLMKLSGKKHLVITGTCLKTNTNSISFDECTEVYFKILTEEEINYYVDKYHPLDKAGAYGIQEWIGMIGVEKIVGSYFNVVGLPVHLVVKHLNSIS